MRAISIADIVKYWNKETNDDHQFEVLHDVYNGCLKFVDPLLEFRCLDTEEDVREFISRNDGYGIYYFPSGQEFLGNCIYYTAICEVVLYGGPKVVEDLTLIAAMRYLCITKEEFRRWLEANGKMLPRFWFEDDGRHAPSPDNGGNTSSSPAVIDIHTGLSRRERESLQKQIAALALVLAEKSAKYKNGERPNGKQIAEAVSEVLDALPDANTYGVSKSALRASIKVGMDLLTG